MAVKKAFQEVYAFLSENQDSTVASLMPELETLMGPKIGGGRGKGTSTSLRFDEEGNLTHIFCYYHKLWEPIDQVEFGKKANSASGYNSMCKEGLSAWTKQQNIAKKAKMELLDNVANGIIAADDVASAQAEIEAARTAIIPRGDGIGEAE